VALGQLLFQNAPSGIVLFRPDGIIEDLNPAFCRMLGSNRKDLEERNWWNLMDSQSMEGALSATQQLLDHKPEAVEFEIRLRGRAGERVWCHVAAALVPGEASPVVQAHLTDITSTAEMQRDLLQRLTRLDEQLHEEHVRSAIALRESEERFRGAFEQAPIGMAIADLEGRIMQVNSAFRAILGYSGDEAVQLSWYDLLDPASDSPNLARLLVRTSVPVPSLQTDARFRMRDGAYREVQWNLSPVRDANGVTKCVIGQITDISARKEAERKLRRYAADLDRSNRDLQDFAYVASHDLQEPLRMVKSYLELLSRRYASQLDDDAREFIGYAADGASRMQHLVAGLLAYSRAGAGSGNRRGVDSKASLDAALANLHMAIRETGAEVTHGPMPVVEADALQLTQLLQNLISNAIKFRSADPPRVHVAAGEKEGGWEFRVRDNGIGLDPRFAQRAFQIFQRLHSPARYPGAGIGLAVCKRIVERHGGEIRVESAPGEGAEFIFSLPAAGGGE